MKSYTLIFFSFLLTFSTQISAHEFWLEASPFYQNNGEKIDISIHVGENMKGERQVNIPAWYKSFNAMTSNGLVDVQGSLGSDPAGKFTTQTDGIYAIAYNSDPYSTKFAAEKFNTYLKKEGLEKIIKMREELGELDKEGIESFARNIKTLVKVGDKNSVNFYDYDFEHPLHFKLMQNPYDLNIGDSLTVQVLFNKKPASNFLLKYQIKGKADFNPGIRTDEQGFATVELIEKGVWMLHGVEMIRSYDPNLDWESFWGNVTFELR